MKFALLGLSLLLPSTLGQRQPIADVPVSEDGDGGGGGGGGGPVGGGDSSVGGGDFSYAPPVAVVNTGAALGRCVNFWAGTAPICRPGSCPQGWHQTSEDSRGDGGKCYFGTKKIYCECDATGVTPGCQSFWSGTAPFCRGECPAGFKEVGSNKSGNGGYCVTGEKKNCQCTTGVPINPCTPGPVKVKCVAFVATCNNGCTTYGCGVCFGSSGRSLSSDDPGTNLYESLLNDQNAPLRGVLSETGANLPADASNEIVAETGLRYVDALGAELDAVDAAASYNTWDDESTWKDVDGQPIQISLPDDIKIPTTAEAAQPVRLQDSGDIPEPVSYSLL